MSDFNKREDAWLRRATAAAIAEARKLVFSDTIKKTTPLGQLSEVEWNWIVAAVLCGWIRTRIKQAASEGGDANVLIHLTGQTPDPWEAGALESILPKLRELALPFDQPMGDWTKEQKISFIGQTHQLVRRAFAARDKAVGSHSKPIQGRRWISIGSRIVARSAIALMRRSDRPKREG